MVARADIAGHKVGTRAQWLEIAEWNEPGEGWELRSGMQSLVESILHPHLDDSEWTLLALLFAAMTDAEREDVLDIR